MTRLTRNGDPRAAQTLKAQLHLRQMIFDGELSAGERVPELMLVERTGVSRTPIRAALLHLAEEGLLEPSSSGGFVVRAFDESEVYDAIDVRGMLEGAAARRAAQRRPRTRNSPSCATAWARWMPSSSAAAGSEQFSDFVRLNERHHSLLLGSRAAPC
jgi:GntR family transcriptional regulator of vanillate catabolism